MPRTWLLLACLTACVGCDTAQKRTLKPQTVAEAGATAEAKSADSPKDYDYKDLSTGSSAFYRR